jgi:hypothetical protein
MWQDKAERALVAVAKLGRRLWREAVAVEDRDWPPFWLYAAGAIIGVIVLINVGSFAIVSLLSSIGNSAGSSHWGLVVETPLRAYVDKHSGSLSVSPTALLDVWGLTGLILFVFSFLGSLGARIGWIVFGLFSCGAVYAGTRPPAQWTATAVAAFAWSVASIIAFHSVARYRADTRTHGDRISKRTIGEEAERRFEEVRKQALTAAKRAGYKDLDDYFGERGHKVIDTISRELRIPKSRVNPLREEYLEATLSSRGTLSPRKQREVITDLRSENYSFSEICERHGCSQEVVRGIRARIVAFDAGERAVRDNSPSSLPASQLSDSNRLGDE